jgi:Xaa-Pro aminopeptidase
VAQFDIAGRIERFRKKFSSQHYDAFVVTRSVNVEYLTGFDDITDPEDPHAVVVTLGSARLVTDSRYLAVARKQAAATGLWEVVDSRDAYIPTELHKVIHFPARYRVACEDSLSVGAFNKLEAGYGEGVIGTPVHNWVEDLRRVKDAGELERIAAAQAITDASFAHICDFIRVGMTEAEVALELEFDMRRRGATGLAFPSIVATGANGANPHAVPGRTRIAAGDLVVLDFGAAYKGYCSDMTRTIAVGAEPSDLAREVYETVLAAQRADLAVLRAGISGVDADKPGRDVIARAGYGEQFGHGTSHGVGLEIHERPSTSPRSKDTLLAGDVISCEPGIYLDGQLGVRIEDLVAIETGGIRNFTQSPKELLVVGT